MFGSCAFDYLLESFICFDSNHEDTTVFRFKSGRLKVKYKSGDIIIPDSVVRHIIEAFCEKEEGVRNMKRCLEIVHTKLNLYRLMRSGTNLFKEDNSLKVEFPFTMTNDIVDKLLKKGSGDKSCFSNSMYL